ncbi:hypothetical protein BS47DRAFT_1485610 [Hydnum rufescens UP504]|uniref:Uncharacterized protein n=1 Tax=Hydnum rufescens UP504 TaxID=1448309 RepID=A0A9P6AXB8_9AGAM|nr:hypothetical protein BS47DRAFT_1485610 [Hydnum rufescens UP504]
MSDRDENRRSGVSREKCVALAGEPRKDICHDKNSLYKTEIMRYGRVLAAKPDEPGRWDSEKNQSDDDATSSGTLRGQPRLRQTPLLRLLAYFDHRFASNSCDTPPLVVRQFKPPPTVETTSALSSPIILEVPITPRMTYPTIQTPPNSMQGPHMGNPPSATSTSSTETMLLCMLQQMQADLAHSMQIQVEMACTNAQMNAHLEELANEN